MAFTGLAFACGGDGPVTPPAEAPCDGVTQAVISLEPFTATRLSGSAVHCAVLAGAGANYLVIPELTDASLPYGGFGFRIGDPEALPTAALRAADALDAAALVEGGFIGRAPVPDAQARLDAALRARERAMPVERAPHAGASAAALRTATPDGARALDTLRRFSVLNTLDATPTFDSVSARLRFEGTRIALYVDTLAGGSLSDVELQQMGALYDAALAPRIFSTFGDGSDVDANGRVIFLLTPTVNAMVTATGCATTGFVRGFFYGHDLASTATTSNRGEVFYAYVPDPSATWSCAHTKAEVLANLPPTFIHELQHMISYGAHVITRGGANEEPWLNEGLSHMAEELGSLYWEERFPAPSGRADPSQLFPDSAAPYINPNLLYSFRYLFSSGSYSLTTCAPGSFCSQSERGGIWLFLRWLADQRGETVFRSLVQTALTGRTNLEGVTGESTAALLGDFAIAVSADSIAGVPRSRVPARYRFASRNLRTIYKRLFDAYGVLGGVGRPFPIAAIALDPGVSRTGTMRPGTFLTYALRTGDQTATVRLRFSIPDGSAFPLSTGAQVMIFRLE
ncbi:MAG: hypothetical protein KA761_01570 [Gemmatimonadaceae bacterium]|nr:hypothetical protein [Gemmatimonadaceae bacterium]